MPGPKPKPTALKVLEGNRGKRKLPKSEPKPRPIRPDCPVSLNESARNLWDDYVDRLEALGTVTEVDQSHLAAFCVAYEQALRYTAFLDEHGETVTHEKTGYIQQRPEVAMANKAWDRVAKFGAELGIGAASRSRIEVKKQDAQDEDPVAKAIAVAAQRV